MDVCESRKDEWGYQVLARLEFAQDLHAADAMYHQTCNVNFRTARQLPSDKKTRSYSKISKRQTKK
ncbi:hypothetical protein DPMN_045050 [Dreissena polymorpha]|uniref:Uncharacterized protein n=1 Tax=Dreissena polymorpha TaxID=45954 RepID=A0A9D4D5B6_DREPO|nr:hypothetical protein DPMN_045050 [Dreissena polymorpha]